MQGRCHRARCSVQIPILTILDGSCPDSTLVGVILLLSYPVGLNKIHLKWSWYEVSPMPTFGICNNLSILLVRAPRSLRRWGEYPSCNSLPPSPSLEFKSFSPGVVVVLSTLESSSRCLLCSRCDSNCTRVRIYIVLGNTQGRVVQHQ